MANTNKKAMSWFWIIFWLLLFWPLGLFFLFKRVTFSPENQEATSEQVQTLPEAAPAQRPNPETSKQQSKIVACSSCGANNILHDTTGECDYCGSAIGAK